MERKPVEVWPVGVFLGQELDARGWSVTDLVAHMPVREAYTELALELTLRVPTPGIYLGVELAQGIADALGTSVEYWLMVDAAWQGANGDA